MLRWAIAGIERRAAVKLAMTVADAFIEALAGDIRHVIIENGMKAFEEQIRFVRNRCAQVALKERRIATRQDDF